MLISQTIRNVGSLKLDLSSTHQVLRLFFRFCRVIFILGYETTGEVHPCDQRVERVLTTCLI
jgi:hypothetical protein